MVRPDSDYAHQTIRNLGGQFLGSGMFASVFAHPFDKTKAIRVARWDGWPQYITWAIEQGWDGIFVPKVYSFKDFGKYYVAVMERLVCTIQESNSHSISDRFYYLQSVAYGNNPNSSYARELYLFGSELKNHPALHANDIHPSNCMLRQDGELVLTDPCSFTPSMEDRPQISKDLRGLLLSNKRKRFMQINAATIAASSNGELPHDGTERDKGSEQGPAELRDILPIGRTAAAQQQPAKQLLVGDFSGNSFSYRGGSRRIAADAGAAKHGERGEHWHWLD